MRKLCGLYLTSIFRVMNSRRMKWAGHVSRMGDRGVEDFGGGLVGKSSLVRPRRRREKILKWRHELD